MTTMHATGLGAAPVRTSTELSQTRAPDQPTGVGGRQDLPVNGQGLPVASRPEGVEERSGQVITDAVEDINTYIQDLRRDLEFTIDEEANRVVIKVLDHETGEIIRQIPPEEVLQVARNLSDATGLLFKEQA